jgi:hypothetical protein
MSYCPGTSARMSHLPLRSHSRNHSYRKCPPNSQVDTYCPHFSRSVTAVQSGRLLSKSVAERCRGAPGWELASGVARPCDRLELAASEKTAERLCLLLPRRPNSSRSGEGHTRRSSCGPGGPMREQDHLLAAAWWAASPLHGCRLSVRPAAKHIYDLACRRRPGRIACPIPFSPNKLAPCRTWLCPDLN